MGLRPEEVIVCGSSSLNIMYDLVSHAYTHGACGGSKPWSLRQNILNFSVLYLAMIVTLPLPNILEST